MKDYYAKYKKSFDNLMFDFQELQNKIRTFENENKRLKQEIKELKYGSNKKK